MLADEKIKHDEYLEMVEDNNNEITQLVEKKNEMLSTCLKVNKYWIISIS